MASGGTISEGRVPEIIVAYLVLFADAIIIMFLIVPDSLAKRPYVLVLLFDVLIGSCKCQQSGPIGWDVSKLATDLCSLCESLKILIDQLGQLSGEFDA